MSVIVIEFVSLDGVTQDPDGSDGWAYGGWAFRDPAAVAGDKFGMGEVLDTGTMLLGRLTWQKFAQIFPSQDDDFAAKLNRMPKLVVSRSLERADEWANSALIRDDVVAEVSRRKKEQDLVVAGSASLVRTLMEHDLVDEYRLLVCPTVLGEGTRLFVGPLDLELVSTARKGQAVLLTYRRTV